MTTKKEDRKQKEFEAQPPHVQQQILEERERKQKENQEKQRLASLKQKEQQALERERRKPKPRTPTPPPPYDKEFDEHYYHVDQLLDRTGPMADYSFETGATPKDFMRKTCKILVIGAGGLGCEILQNLALLGFGDIHVIDMDTIDISNLNRQFLFREKDIGQPKAEIAAKFIMERVPKHYCKIQDKDDAFYMQFNLVVCGLDSVQARRWINATMVNLVDPENPESLKPLIDGGTEGTISGDSTYDHILLRVFSGHAHPTTVFPICTIANTPRLPEHCIEWASVLEWPRVFKAIASTNAIIAASCCNEAFKIATTCAPYLQNYMMYNGNESIYTYTFEHQKKPDCPVCGGESVQITINKDWELQKLVDYLIERPDLTFIFQGPEELRKSTEPNLEKTLIELFPVVDQTQSEGIEITVTDSSLPFQLSLLVKLQ
ncbi:hypothetical protein H4Q26_000270 [Puccinia striiformis f. sp. tritici PST-130]|nr:hypothetical protein H4Q26_000270 [Puccinia striiformis f. sp. tritici PST-130]